MFAGFLLVLVLVEDVKSAPASARPSIHPLREASAPRGKTTARHGNATASHGTPDPFSWRRLITGSARIVFVTLFLVRFSQMLPGPFIPLYVQEFLGRIEGAAVISGSISAATGAATAIAGISLVRLGDRYSR